jgi:hypothetical protein
LEKEKGNWKKNRVFIILGIFIVTIIALFVWRLLSKPNVEETIVGVQQTNDIQTNESKIPKKTPNEVMEEYLTAIQANDYEGAAPYISQNAKTISEGLAKDTAGRLYDIFSEKPLVEFLVGTIEDTEYPDKKLQTVRQTMRDSWGNNRKKNETYIMELEKGEWKVNPTFVLSLINLIQ